MKKKAILKSRNVPNVAIIIPVYNAESYITRLFSSLKKIKYPKNKFQVIFVDNNSTDNSRDQIRNHGFTLLLEKKRGSYAARNKGISYASDFQIIAFTDADCVVSPKWIKEGVISLEKADIVAGNVKFLFSKKVKATEIYDSLSNIQVKSAVQFGKAPTANLFVNIKVFKELGRFPDYVKSGGDMQWTSKAVRNGYKLLYNQEAVVFHPTRDLFSLICKNFRVGQGLLYIWIQNSDSPLKIFINIVRDFLPPNICSLKKSLSKYNNSLILKVMLVKYTCNIVRGISVLISIPFFLTFLISRKRNVEKNE